MITAAICDKLEKAANLLEDALELQQETASMMSSPLMGNATMAVLLRLKAAKERST